MNKLQDGVYPAHLAAAQARLSANGRPMVEFLWRIDGTDRSIKSFLCPTLADGSPNAKGVALARRWAKEWDGEDVHWFAENLAYCSQRAVKLTVKNEPWRQDPSRMRPCVRWVNPAEWTPLPEAICARPARTADSAAELDRDALAELPEDLDPTMRNVWSAFALLYRKAPPAKRDADWIELVKKLFPGKLQIRFSPEDWSAVLARVRSGDVAV